MNGLVKYVVYLHIDFSNNRRCKKANKNRTAIPYDEVKFHSNYYKSLMQGRVKTEPAQKYRFGPVPVKLTLLSIYYRGIVHQLSIHSLCFVARREFLTIVG